MTNIKLFGVKYTYCALHIFIGNLAFNKKIHIDFRIDFFLYSFISRIFHSMQYNLSFLQILLNSVEIGNMFYIFFSKIHTLLFLFILFFWYKSTLGYIQQPHTVQCVCVHGYARNSNVLLNVHWLEHNSASKLFATKSFRLN